MASVVVGTKRPFSAVGEDSGGTLPMMQSLNSGALAAHLRPGFSASATPTSFSSGLTTRQPTPISTPLPSNSRRNFQPDASIVIIGMRGAGKSTLAVIASIACRRRLVDVDDLFHEATGFTTARYRKQFGAANHSLRQEELLQTTLRTYDKNAIIVCNGGALERNGQMLVQEFAKTHPVVHIVRDIHSIHEYLGGVELGKLKDVLRFTGPILRRCSNYEFFNLAEGKIPRPTQPDDPSAAPAFLTLKRAQRTFLKFLSLITSSKDMNCPIGTPVPPLEPGYPLSDVATELREHTCAVQVPLSDLLAEDVDIQALEYGSDAFEIVLDPSQFDGNQQGPSTELADDISNCMSKVRRSTVVPIIYNVVQPSNMEADRSSYLDYVRHGLRMAPEYATVDLTLGEHALSEVITSAGIAKIIGCLHSDKSWDDPFWTAQYELGSRLGCSLIRFTRPADSLDDEFRLRQLRSKLESTHSLVPLTCYNTGKAGRRSACFNSYLTPVIPGSVKNDVAFLAKAKANSQLPWVTAREITQALYASFTLDPMHIYIIGASLGYSVSPAMHNTAYNCCGMPHQFDRIQSSSLNSLKELVRESNFGGSIVIQPYKVEVISLTDSLSQHARAIGAVNTLIPVRHLKDDGSVPSDLQLFRERNQSGRVLALYGDNTEWIGIRSCVRRGLTPANAVRPVSCGLVIGAGGMARAAVYALLQLGVRNIVIFNRTYQKAENLVAHFTRLAPSKPETTLTPTPIQQGLEPRFRIMRSREDAWPEDMRQPTIILSCIPADPIDGGPAAHFTLPTQWLQSSTGGVVMEIAYKTLNTPLMQQMQHAGSMWTYMDGLDFIPEQAFAQFELFTGKRAPRKIMREEVLRAWRDEQGNSDPEMVQRRLKAIDDQES